MKLSDYNRLADSCESEVQSIKLSSNHASSCRGTMQRIFRSRAIEIASHVPGVDIVYWREGQRRWMLLIPFGIP